MSDRPPRRVGRLPWFFALPAAALGGLALDAATPWLSWWAAAFIGAGLIAAAVWQQRAWSGLGIGAVAGASFWLPHIHWLTLYLGPIPWLGLSGVMIAWFALFGLVAAVATRGIAQLPYSRRAIVATQAIAVAGLWVTREQLQSTWPYGGFAWGRLAHPLADSPLASLVSWLGFSGLSGLVALACALAVAPWFARPRQPVIPVLVSGLTVAALALLALVPPAPLAQTGALTVAAVQGNSKSGIFDDRENGDVFQAHLDATERLLDDLERRGQRVDVIVWPENSAEFDVRRDASRSLALRELSMRAGAPIVVGTILRDPDGSFTNSTLVFDIGGDTGLRYDKRRPVPFAEYMPNRDFFHSLAPDLVDLVQLEYRAGARSAMLDIDGASGRFAAGIAICFDIIFDDHAEAMMRDGAQVVFAQTNNADFGRTDESAQQLQIARLRAVETGRAVVNISTVGTSAIVAPDGSTLASIEPHTAGFMVAEMPLVEGDTPALRFGAWIAAAWMLLGLGGIAAGLVGRLRFSPRPSDGP